MYVVPGVRYATVQAVVSKHLALRARAVGLDPDDIVADVCLAMLEGRVVYDPERGGEYSFVRVVARTVFCRRIRNDSAAAKARRSLDGVPALHVGQWTLGSSDAEGRVGCLRAIAERFGSVRRPAEKLFAELLQRNYEEPSARAELRQFLRGKRPRNRPGARKRRELSPQTRTARAH